VYVCVDCVCLCVLVCVFTRVYVCVMCVSLSLHSRACVCKCARVSCALLILLRKMMLDTPSRLYYTNVFLWQVLDRSVVGDQFWFPDGWVASNQFFLLLYSYKNINTDTCGAACQVVASTLGVHTQLLHLLCSTSTKVQILTGEGAASRWVAFDLGVHTTLQVLSLLALLVQVGSV